MRRKKKGEMNSLERSVSTRLPKGKWGYEQDKLSYVIPHKYNPDFTIKTDSRTIYLEVKGFLRWEDQQKMKAVKVSNPDLDIRFFFPRDQKVHKSKMLNSEWCEKYGFPYAIGKIPRGWFK